MSAEDQRRPRLPAGPAALRSADPRFSEMGMATQCVHAGERVDQAGLIASCTPVYHATTYMYGTMQELDDVFQRRRAGYVYSRYGTPTHSALERALATLEGAGAALSCASGMAACHLALLACGLQAGDLVLSSSDIYGTTYQLIHALLPRLGLRACMANFQELDRLETLLRERRPRAVFLEVMTNPLIRVLDLPTIVDLAHRYDASVIVDNTFTTPMLLRPFEFGADWVIHSLTKFLSGHGDVLAGAVLCRKQDFDGLYTASLQVGSTLGPQDAYLALRGLKTFPLRFARQCESALRIARYLESHPLVARVHYPGLESHPHHDLAGRLFGGRRYGAVVSFEVVEGNRTVAFRILEALRVILPATTLGDIQSTMMYPAHSSHASLSEAELAKAGISKGLLRLSVGIEDVDDIQRDLDQALTIGARGSR